MTFCGIEASNAVLTGYERPADQSTIVQMERWGCGLGYYVKFVTALDDRPIIGEVILPNVPPNVSDWARDAWDWAKDIGICDGTRSKDSLTREEAVTMIYRLHNIKVETLK